MDSKGISYVARLMAIDSPRQAAAQFLTFPESGVLAERDTIPDRAGILSRSAASRHKALKNVAHAHHATPAAQRFALNSPETMGFAASGPSVAITA